MDFLEKDLEQIIFDAHDETLHNRGLYLYGTKKRQLNIGNYGIADIVSFCRARHPSGSYLIITIVELKQKQINVGTFLQAIRYAKGIDRYLKKRNFSFQVKFEIMLIGRNIDTSSSFPYIFDFFNNRINDKNATRVSGYTYDYDIDGISFTEVNDYKLTKEGF
jgi:hypothetical protein